MRHASSELYTPRPHLVIIGSAVSFLRVGKAARLRPVPGLTAGPADGPINGAWPARRLKRDRPPSTPRLSPPPGCASVLDDGCRRASPPARGRLAPRSASSKLRAPAPPIPAGLRSHVRCKPRIVMPASRERPVTAKRTVTRRPHRGRVHWVWVEHPYAQPSPRHLSGRRAGAICLLLGRR